MTECTASFRFSIKATRKRDVPNTQDEYVKTVELIKREIAELHKRLEHYQFAIDMDNFCIY